MIFCDPAVTISTNLLLIFVCVPHQLKINTHGEMLPLETKQSGGKLLPHSDLRGGVFLEEAPRSRQRKRD